MVSQIHQCCTIAINFEEDESALVPTRWWLVGYVGFIKNKVSLQTSLERNSSNFSYISFFCLNFEDLTVKFHVLYVLNMHIKFLSNWILFTIWSVNLFFIHNFRSQKFKILIFVWLDSNWSLIFFKFCIHKEYNKNIESND